MVAPRRASSSIDDSDQRVFLHGVSWKDYETLLAIRGDDPGPRMTFLEGELELMSPSRSHEWIKKTMARLLEVYAMERGVTLEGYGSWTLKSAPRERGAEPDECYMVGDTGKDIPDLAIEVVWTSGGIDKLEVYRGLGVREVWFWRSGVIEVYLLEGEAYARHPRSQVLPELDLALLARCLESAPTQTAAVVAFLEAIRSGTSQ
jgi:Uma2 family endonuclease